MLLMLVGIGLLLQGCTKGKEELGKEQEQQQEDYQLSVSELEGQIPETEPQIREQVLEVGILADCSNPYTVEVFGTFCVEAGKSSRPVVVELHDSRDSYELQQAQLETLKEHGVDLFLVDIVEADRQQGLMENLEGQDCPVIYFGTRLKEDARKDTKNIYMGITLEEERELKKALTEGHFEESDFFEKAAKTGKELLETVLDMFAEE